MIRIELFGQIQVCSGGDPRPALSAKQRQILAILALSNGSPVPRERLADELWEGAPPVSYVGTLDSYVCVLRRALGLAAGRSSALATTAAGFVLELGDDVEVDLNWFYLLARAADARTGRPALEWAEEAVTLVQGSLLSEVPYAAWAVRAREQFARTLVELCTRNAQRANGLGEFERASRLARCAVEHDPVCEEAWRQLMLAHWFSGGRGRALSVYAEFRTAMADFLGDEPGRASQELYLTVLKADVGVPHSSPRSSLEQVKTLLRLLRQELDLIPGVRAPSLDAQLSEVAARALYQSAD
jgi:DNA-binding SARP family transcriptional activator